MVYDFILLLSNAKEVSIFPYVAFLVYYVLISSQLVIGGNSLGTEAHQPM